MGIEEIVDVQISIQDTSVSRAGFGVPLILGLHTAFGTRTRFYATLEEVLADFAANDPVGRAAAALFGQDLRPTKIGVGRIDVGDASLGDSIQAVRDENDDWYMLITTDHSDATILAAAAAIQPLRKIYGASSADADILNTAITTDIASQLKALTYDRTFLIYNALAGTGVNELTDITINDIATFFDVSGAAKSFTLPAGIGYVWYDVTDGSNSQADPGGPGTGVKVDILAADIATGIATKTDTALGTSGLLVSNSVASATVSIETLASSESAPNALDVNANVTILVTQEGSEPQYSEAAWAGGILPLDPGSVTWFGKKLSSVTISELTTTQKSSAFGKNANTYSSIAGVGITQNGVMASGRFIDIRRGVDWLQARIEERIFFQIANLAKIPYTDPGVAIIENELRAQLIQAVDRGVLAADPPFTVTVPKVLDVAPNDRANRCLPDVKFEARLAGAIHKVIIRGVVQV